MRTRSEGVRIGSYYWVLIVIGDEQDSRTAVGDGFAVDGMQSSLEVLRQPLYSKSVSPSSAQTDSQRSQQPSSRGFTRCSGNHRFLASLLSPSRSLGPTKIQRYQFFLVLREVFGHIFLVLSPFTSISSAQINPEIYRSSSFQYFPSCSGNRLFLRPSSWTSTSLAQTND